MRYGERGIVNWNLDGSTMPKLNAVAEKKVGVPTEGEESELKKESLKEDKVEVDSGDEFDADEEEAMIQATIEIEKQEGIAG